MRRKSDRTAGKKTKASPEKKIEKVKRTRSRRKKQSTSSENESAEEASPVREAEPAPVIEENPPQTAAKEDSPEEAQDQVWRVKAAEGSGDTGEIQKLKICLTRPPTTPERVDRSPRSKRKHSRATSSSDGTPSVEAPEEKRKTKHRTRRSHRESKDESEKTQDSQEDEPESEIKTNQEEEKQSSSEPTQSDAEGKVDSSENIISTSNEETKGDEKANVDSTEDTSKKEDNEKSEDKSEKSEKEDKASDADTTVVSPKAETTVVSATPEPKTPSKTENQESPSDDKTPEPESPTRRRSASVDKSEILELHPEDSKVESDIEVDKTKGDSKQTSAEKAKDEEKVSKTQDKTPIEELKSDNDKPTNKTGVVESSKVEKISRSMSIDSRKNEDTENVIEKSMSEDDKRKSFERSNSIQSNHEEPHQNGIAAPIVVSRKRRWGSRPSKITKQKSITISTEVLKDIIPDVKPVEFEEVIEEKKHKRVVTEKIERPILPKIIIDNSENVQRAEQERNTDRKDRDDKDIVKARDIASNRKISIIKDNDSIITRPPSPPRHKQSRVLYITNLVRPFTLPQLKNLLQRTGRLVENGFWIDRIKSKCFVIYETEDQAVETRHALHGVTWPVSNPKTLQVDFSTQEAFDKAKMNEETDNAQVSTIPGTVEDWLREQDMKRERGEVEKPWERKLATREWDLGKNDKDKEKDRQRRDERPLLDKRRHRTPERSPEPARKFKKKEEEAPAKLLDDLFKKTKATPCIYWLPLSAETIAIKEEQRRQHMAEHERRMQEQRRTHRRH